MYPVWTVTHVPGCSEAFRIVAREPIDVVVTDVRLPGSSGPEVAERIQGAMPAVKLIFMSGHTDDLLSGEAATTRAGEKQASDVLTARRDTTRIRVRCQDQTCESLPVVASRDELVTEVAEQLRVRGFLNVPVLRRLDEAAPEETFPQAVGKDFRQM